MKEGKAETDGPTLPDPPPGGQVRPRLALGAASWRGNEIPDGWLTAPDGLPDGSRFCNLNGDNSPDGLTAKTPPEGVGGRV